MIQSQRLERGLKGMVEMESDGNQQDDIDDTVIFVAEKTINHRVKIVFVFYSFRHGQQSLFHKIKVDEMDDEKEQKADSRVYHKT